MSKSILSADIELVMGCVGNRHLDSLDTAINGRKYATKGEIA